MKIKAIIQHRTSYFLIVNFKIFILQYIHIYNLKFTFKFFYN